MTYIKKSYGKTRIIRELFAIDIRKLYATWFPDLVLYKFYYTSFLILYCEYKG